MQSERPGNLQDSQTQDTHQRGFHSAIDLQVPVRRASVIRLVGLVGLGRGFGGIPKHKDRQDGKDEIGEDIKC